MKQYFDFKQETGQVIFTGDSLEIWIPDRYENYGMLHVDEFVVALGIFDIRINGDQEAGFMLPATIRMEPTELETVNTGTGAFTKVTLYKGDVFMQGEVVQDPNIAYVMFREFVFQGRPPQFLKYRMAPFMFDIVSDVTGTNFHVDHSIFEIMFTYLFRDESNTSVQYRHTDMRKKPRLIPLEQAYNLADTTTSKLLGNYFDSAVDASLVNKADRNTELEEILRG